MKTRQVLFGAFVSIILLSGCSQEKGESKSSPDLSPTPTAAAEPVTLKVYMHYAPISDDQFKNYIADPVTKKYPNISLQLVRYTKEANTPEKMVAAGDFPDLIFESTNFLRDYIDLGIPIDLNALIKKTKFDLNRFDPTMMNYIKKFGGKGEVYAIPMTLNSSGLFYNKDIFDKFAAPYPSDNMTWDDAISLAKKVARTDNGEQIMPLFVGTIAQLASPLSTPYVDPKTGKAAINTENWKTAFELFATLSEIPGNEEIYKYNNINRFKVDRNMAMIAGYNIIPDLVSMPKDNPLNWDVVSYPTYKQAPGKGMETIGATLMISSTGKHQDDAFKVISAVSEKENHLKMSRDGKLSALSDPQVRQEYGANISQLKGKNVQGMFKVTPSEPRAYSKYNANIQQKVVIPAVVQMITKHMDVNTILLQTNDQANKLIEDGQ